MDESFVGHEARFSLPCDDSMVSLLMGFIAELLVVGGSDVEAPEQVEEQIRVAIEEICGRRDGADGVTLADADPGSRAEIRATLSIVGEGVEVKLRSAHDGRELPPILVREK